MLPKEEKIKKKSDSSQPGLFDKDNDKKRLRQKRLLLYLALFFTVGLSVFFWVYRSLKSFSTNFQFPSLHFSLPSKNNHQPDLNIDQNSTWSIYLQQANTDTVIYQQNSDLLFTNQDLPSISTHIDQANFVNSSQYSSLLPQGIKVKEIIQENDQNFSYFSKIITPNQELFLIINISNSSNLDQAKKLLPNLINQLYWYSLQK